MLDKAFKDNSNINNLIFHSDQGWQYQHNFYTKRLEEKNIIPVSYTHLTLPTKLEV